MSPEEVLAATMSHDDIPEHLKRQWYLCGDIPEQFWDALAHRKDEVGFRLSAFTTPEKTVYATFTLQIAQSQVRFLMPLGRGKSTRFLRESAQSGVMLLLSRNDSDRAIVRQFMIESAHLTPLVELAKLSRHQSRSDEFMDLGLSTLEMRSPTVVPSIFAGEQVKDVHVIAIMPASEDWSDASSSMH